MNLYLETQKILKAKKPEYKLEDTNKPFDSTSFVLLMLAVMQAKGISSIDVSTIEKDISKCCIGEEFAKLTENIYKIEEDHLDLALGMSKLNLFQRAYESKKSPIIKIDMEDEIVEQILENSAYEGYVPLMQSAVSNYKREYIGNSKVFSFFAKNKSE